MEKKTLVRHAKGQKRVGKTNWSKVRANLGKPVVDAENPDIAFTMGKSFYKAHKRRG